MFVPSTTLWALNEGLHPPARFLQVAPFFFFSSSSFLRQPPDATGEVTAAGSH